MTEMFGEAWSPMSVPDLAPDDDDSLPEFSINYSLPEFSVNHSLPKFSVNHSLPEFNINYSLPELSKRKLM